MRANIICLRSFAQFKCGEKIREALERFAQIIGERERRTEVKTSKRCFFFRLATEMFPSELSKQKQSADRFHTYSDDSE